MWPESSGPQLADPLLAELLVAETVDADRGGAAALGLFAEMLEPRVPRAARVACRWLRAVALERIGDIEEAEREMLAAESMDPDWSQGSGPYQIDEVERIQQRCAQRVKRFTAFGTMEQSRGVARQLNDAIGAARALLKSSFTDSRSANPPTMGAMAATSCNPRVVSCAAPTNAAVHPAVANAMAIRSRGASRSAGGESSNVNAAMMKPATRSRRRSRTAVAVSMCCFSIVPCANHRF